MKLTSNYKVDTDAKKCPYCNGSAVWIEFEVNGESKNIYGCDNLTTHKCFGPSTNAKSTREQAKQAWEDQINMVIKRIRAA